MEVKVFSTPSCPWCEKTKEFLKSQGVKYKDLNVVENQEAANEMIEKTGQRGVPVTMIDNMFIIGYDKDALEQALKTASS